MNCHGNHDNKNTDGSRKKGHFSHMLMMLLCCGAPVLILLLVPFLRNIGGGGLAGFMAIIAPFICPVMMLLMIPMMLRGRKNKENNNCHSNQINISEKTQE